MDGQQQVITVTVNTVCISFTERKDLIIAYTRDVLLVDQGRLQRVKIGLRIAWRCVRVCLIKIYEGENTYLYYGE